MRAPALLLLSLLAGCSILPKEGIVHLPLEERAEVIADEVAKVRRLELLRSVPVDRKDEVQLADVMARELEEVWEEEGAYLERAYKVLGLVRHDVDLRTTFEHLLTEQVAGYYDPETEEFFVIDKTAAESQDDAEDADEEDDEHDEDMERASEKLDEDFVLAHELVHAVEDQHFDFDAVEEARDFDSDEAAAWSALVEGSAMEGGVDQLLYRLGAPLSVSGPLLRAVPRWIGRIEPTDLAASLSEEGDGFEEAPALLQASLIFPYMHGWSFTNRIRSEFGWAGVDAAYADPPESTEQILFPERYLDRRDRPVAITLPPPPAGWTAVHEDALGMLGLRVLLAERLDADAVDEADGWDGDRFVLWDTPAGDALGWVLAFDHAGQAEDFAEAYEALLRWNEGETDTWAVARDGLVVAVAQGTPAGEADDAARHLLANARVTPAADDQPPLRWWWTALRFPIALRSLDRVFAAHLLGGLVLDLRAHDEGYRLSLLRSLVWHSEHTPDRTAVWTALGLIGGTRDDALDYTFWRVPLVATWHGRESGDARRAKLSLLPFRMIDYENERGAKQFDLLWGGILRVRWGARTYDGDRLRILFVPIPGV